MTVLSFTPAAEADLDAIWDYTATTWGLAQAERYIDDIEQACLALLDGRKEGRPVVIRKGYLKSSVGQHMIYFRCSEAELIVVRILHQSMDVERHL